MKQIKTYRLFEAECPELYTEITMRNYEEILDKKHIKMDVKDIQSIIDLVKSLGDGFTESVKYVGGDLTIQLYMIFYNGRPRFGITKIEDEYFLVNIEGHRFYKCDQIDGVISLLKKYIY